MDKTDSTTNRTSRVTPPPLLDKYSIIPIHTSDRAAFKACRRRWGWSSPSRSNLVPRVSIMGIREPFWFGTGCHYALERYYHPGLKEDPEVTWLNWFNLQWDGGLVHADEVAAYADRYPQPYQGKPNIFVIKGLNELLPDPDPEVFMAFKDLGLGMMKFYKTYAEREDNFTVIMTEHSFSVPIMTPEGTILEWMDNRAETAPVKMKQVHARGKMDCIVQDNETGQYGIIDHKTAGKIDDDYFRHLDLDDQCTTYWWAAEREAEIHDLDYKVVDFIIYNAIRKAYPTPPTITSRGLPSVDRQKESTTAQLFEQCIKDNNLQVIFNDNVTLQTYYSYLVEMGDKLFIQRDTVRRNRNEITNCGTKLYYEAVDMLNNPALYHNPTKNYDCLNCVFRAPCKAVEAGYDYEEMLLNGYESNYDR